MLRTAEGSHSIAVVQMCPSMGAVAGCDEEGGMFEWRTRQYIAIDHLAQTSQRPTQTLFKTAARMMIKETL